MSDNGTPGATSVNERGELVLSIEALRPKPRWLDLGGGTMVKIPGGLDLDTMLEIQALEAELKSSASTEETARQALTSFTALLTRIINDANPDLPDDFRLTLGIQEATHLLVFIAQPNDSVAEAFAEAITAGGTEKPDGASDDARAMARAAGLEPPEKEGKKAAPLRSAKPSSSRSSRSARSTTGRRSGGSGRAARSKRSGSTSATRSESKPSAKLTK